MIERKGLILYKALRITDKSFVHSEGKKSVTLQFVNPALLIRFDPMWHFSYFWGWKTFSLARNTQRRLALVLGLLAGGMVCQKKSKIKHLMTTLKLNCYVSVKGKIEITKLYCAIVFLFVGLGCSTFLSALIATGLTNTKWLYLDKEH